MDAFLGGNCLVMFLADLPYNAFARQAKHHLQTTHLFSILLTTDSSNPKSLVTQSQSHSVKKGVLSNSPRYAATVAERKHFVMTRQIHDLVISIFQPYALPHHARMKYFMADYFAATNQI